MMRCIIAFIWEYISRVENNGSNLTLKTLFDIVEKGLRGKVKISIEV